MKSRLDLLLKVGFPKDLAEVLQQLLLQTLRWLWHQLKVQLFR